MHRRHAKLTLRHKRSFLLAATVCLGCGIFGLDWVVQVRPGRICCYNEADPHITVPDTAPASAVSVSVDTYGDGCYFGGQTEIAVTGDTITVSPFDTLRYRDAADFACPRIGRTFRHDATISVARPARYTVRFIGVAGYPETTAVYLRTVVVR